MVITITIGALGIVPKGIVKVPEDLEIRRQLETIQTIASLKSDNTEKIPDDLLLLKQ